MPWKIFPDGGQFCIHKQTADGGKGAKVACHPDEDKAKAQLRALYANAKESLPPEDEWVIREEGASGARKDVSPADKKRAEKEYGNVEYADPTNKKYPIDAKHVHAAWNYINKAKNAAKYSASKLKAMKSRIAAAFKRVTGHAPPSSEEGKSKEAEELSPELEAMISEWCDHMADDITEQEMTMEAARKDPDAAEEKNEKGDSPEEEKGEEQAMNQPVKHNHEHMHGSFQHTHPHEHDKEHGVDGKFGKHDHPHQEKEAVVMAQNMGSLIRSGMKATCSECDEDMDIKDLDEAADTIKCPKCGATLKIPSKKESVRILVFGEMASLREAEVDRARKSVNVTIIKPGWSVNGRYYSKEVLTKAIPVFEGTKCFIDHPTIDEDSQRPERSVSDIAGYYRNVKQSDDGRLTGQLILIGKRGEEMLPLIQETIANKPDLIGLSINAMGETAMGEAEGRSGIIVKQLSKAFGTDIVTTASAGGRFEKLMQSGDEMTTALLQSLSYDEWRQVNSEFVARMKKEMRTARKEELESAALKEAAAKETVIQEQSAQIEQLKESVKGLETKLADQERESAIRVSEATADLKLLESGLPEEWRTTLRPQLIAKPDEMAALIEAERKKYFAIKEPVRVTNAGTSDALPPTVDPALQVVAEALKMDATIYPLDNESPEEYALRKKKMTRR